MNTVIDKKRFGRRLKAARIDAGYENMVDLANAIEDRHGIEIAAPTLYSYESGRTIPSFATILVLLAVLQPVDGMAHFRVAVRSDVAEAVFNLP